MTKPKCGKWPYDFTIVAVDIIRNSSGSTKAQELICAALADAYAEGFKAGRASRDGLMEASLAISKRWGTAGLGRGDEHLFDALDKAIAADEARAGRKKLREALKRIADADYRGHRSSESAVAFEALSEDEKNG